MANKKIPTARFTLWESLSTRQLVNAASKFTYGQCVGLRNHIERRLEEGWQPTARDNAVINAVNDRYLDIKSLNDASERAVEHGVNTGKMMF